MTAHNTVIAVLDGGLRFGEARVSGPLTVVPVFHEGPAVAYRLFVEALGEGLVAVEEVNGGSVPELAVVNRGGDAVLLVEGEVVGGLRQTRTLNTSVLVPAQSTVVIPVSCVEQHRWGASLPVEREPLPASPGVRSVKNSTVRAAARRGDAYESDQHQVWGAVDRHLMGHGVFSDTGSYAEVQHRRRGDLERLTGALLPEAGQRGVLALAHGRPLALDVFDRPETLARLWEGLVGSYAADALVAPPAGSNGGAIDAARLAASLARGEVSTHPAVGRGEVVFVSSLQATVSALVAGESLVHLAALWAPGTPAVDPRPPVAVGGRRSWFGEPR